MNGRAARPLRLQRRRRQDDDDGEDRFEGGEGDGDDRGYRPPTQNRQQSRTSARAVRVPTVTSTVATSRIIAATGRTVAIVRIAVGRIAATAATVTTIAARVDRGPNVFSAPKSRSPKCRRRSRLQSRR